MKMTLRSLSSVETRSIRPVLMRIQKQEESTHRSRLIMSSDSFGFDFFTFSKLPRKLTGILELPGMVAIFSSVVLGCYLLSSGFQQSGKVTSSSIAENDHRKTGSNGMEDGRCLPSAVMILLFDMRS